MTALSIFPAIKAFDAIMATGDRERAVSDLEHGHVLIFDHVNFPLDEKEKAFLTEKALDGSRKNIGYHHVKHRLHGDAYQGEQHECLKQMLQRYATQVETFVRNLFPHYANDIVLERTTYRPAEISGREAKSFRKDDKRLHVDAFSASPSQGFRSLRVFTNINPEGKPRVWRVGEPFPDLVKRFRSTLRVPRTTFFYTLKNCLGITKKRMTKYDDMMLQLHHAMKADVAYQKNAPQKTIAFAPATTWVVFSDQVSHAVMSGKFMLEQTFLLPVEAMQSPELSPLKVLEKTFSSRLK